MEATKSQDGIVTRKEVGPPFGRMPTQITTAPGISNHLPTPRTTAIMIGTSSGAGSRRSTSGSRPRHPARLFGGEGLQHPGCDHRVQLGHDVFVFLV